MDALSGEGNSWIQYRRTLQMSSQTGHCNADALHLLLVVLTMGRTVSMYLEETSKLTDRYQTTVPSGVRKQLNLQKGDRIRYCVEQDGRIFLEPVRDVGDDPALGPFLDFLEKDIQAHPEKITAFDRGVKDRVDELVSGVELDLDSELSPDDE